jgi:hypothetical protein
VTYGPLRPCLASEGVKIEVGVVVAEGLTTDTGGRDEVRCTSCWMWVVIELDGIEGNEPWLECGFFQF